MNHQTRMSPLTALVIGIFGVGAVGIAAGAGIVLYGMRIINTTASALLGFTESAVENLPELIDSLPPAIGELLNDRRAPDYSSNIDLDVNFVPSQEGSSGLRPVMTITNNGSEVVSMLAVRVAALNGRNLPVQEWTEVVATPVAICNDWRGPLMPGATRHVVISRWRTIPAEQAADITGAVEISEIRVWRPAEGS